MGGYQPDVSAKGEEDWPSPSQTTSGGQCMACEAGKALDLDSGETPLLLLLVLALTLSLVLETFTVTLFNPFHSIHFPVPDPNPASAHWRNRVPDVPCGHVLWQQLQQVRNLRRRFLVG
jgi:hypothetical protein